MHTFANTAADPVVVLRAVGDIMLFGRYDAIADARVAENVFADLSPSLQTADLVVGNLECVLTERGQPRDDKLCLQARPLYADALRRAGFTHLSLANNHAFDFGLEGYRETQGHLSTAGIGSFGAGTSLEQALEPLILRCKGLSIGLMAACDASTQPGSLAATSAPGPAPLLIDELEPRIRALRPQVDHLVLVLHWGFEYSDYPTPDQARLAMRLIDAGATVILGHHSHKLQGIQRYRDGIIVYSLGNLTDSDVDWQGPRRHYQSQVKDVDRESVILTLELTRTGVARVETLPLWLNDAGRPERATDAVAARIQASIQRRSEGLEPAALERYWQQAVVSNRVLGPLRYWWSNGSLLDKLRRFNLGQIKSLYLLLATLIQVKFSRSRSKWRLLNPRNDTRPMPSSGGESEPRAERSNQGRPG